MKICFVGPADSAHIEKWCNWFISHGHEVHVISFVQGKIPDVYVHLINLKVDVNGSDLGKLKYLFTGRKIRKLINEIAPDVVNAHYATSYGMAMALSGIKGYVLSVWGADIYDFPKKSLFHKLLLEFSLKKAGRLFSTSQAMADEAKKYTNRKFEITPFGVDVKLFNPNKRSRQKNNPMIIGIVKRKKDFYKIDYILKAVEKIIVNYPEIECSLKIIGNGPQVERGKKLVKELEIEREVGFFNRMSNQEMTNELLSIVETNILLRENPVTIYNINDLVKSKLFGITKGTVLKKDENVIAEVIINLYRDFEMQMKKEFDREKNVFKNVEIKQCPEYIESVLQVCEECEMQETIMAILTIKKKERFIVGTVKGLYDKYGIRYILEAVADIKKENIIPIQLRIAGRGPQEQEYHDLADKLGISDITNWLGFISQKDAAEEWANMDLAIVPSTLESESFGVAAVEAQACGTAVIISDVPGLMEATKPGITSIVVPRNNSEAIKKAIYEMYLSTNKRFAIGTAGRYFVTHNYELSYCFKKIEKIFEQCAMKGLKNEK